MQAPKRRHASATSDETVTVEEKRQAVREETTLIVPFLAEIFLAVVFWSVIAEAVPALWYIPMNLMHISGLEPLLFIYILPCVLSLRAAREATWNIPLLNLVAVPSLATLYTPDVLTYGSFSMVCSGVYLTLVVGQLMHPNAALRERRVYSLLLGLLALVALRFGLSSVSPFYLYESANILGIGGSIISAFVLHKLRPVPVRVPGPSKPAASRSSDIATYCGFGFFLLLNVMFLTEHGVLARWGDVHPFPFGLAMMASFILGLFLSRQSFVRSWTWYIVALVATIFFLIVNTPIGALSGLIMVVYLVSIWPTIVEEIAHLSYIGRSFFIGGFVYSMGCLGTVWCIAYNFVPGGFFVREYTPQLVGLAMLGTKMAYHAKPVDSSTSSASLNLGAVNVPVRHRNAQNARLLLIGLAVIGIVVFAPAFIKRFSSYNNFDAHGLDTTNLRGMVWATHFGYDNFGRPSYEAMLELIKKSSSNVIALVETDVMRLFNGNRDLVEWLQERLHLYADYGPGTNDHTWGCALLSAFPFKRVERSKLPSPDGENACLIDATLDVHGKDVDVIMAHFGNTEHERDRKLQTEDSYHRLKERIDAGKRVVWLGYFTSAPGSTNYNRIMSTGVIDTTDATDRYCEYVWYKNMQLKEFKRIAQGHVSDTEIQYAEFERF